MTRNEINSVLMELFPDAYVHEQGNATTTSRELQEKKYNYAKSEYGSKLQIFNEDGYIYPDIDADITTVIGDNIYVYLRSIFEKGSKEKAVSKKYGLGAMKYFEKMELTDEGLHVINFFHEGIHNRFLRGNNRHLVECSLYVYSLFIPRKELLKFYLTKKGIKFEETKDGKIKSDEINVDQIELKMFDLRELSNVRSSYGLLHKMISPAEAWDFDCNAHDFSLYISLACLMGAKDFLKLSRPTGLYKQKFPREYAAILYRLLSNENHSPELYNLLGFEPPEKRQL